MAAAKAGTRHAPGAFGVIQARSAPVAKLAFLFALPYASTGCMATSLYTTPDTLAPGKVQGVNMLDAWRVERNMGPLHGGLFGDRHEQLEGFSIIPSAMVRRGVIDNIEVGLGILRADVKVRVMHTETVSIAVNPIGRANLAFEAPGNGGVAEVPVLIGVHVEHAIVVVANTGLSYTTLAVAQGPNVDDLAVRAGLGVRLQLHRVVAIQPEVTYLRSIAGRSLDWLSGGVAIDFGGIP
jgi:hypothetical protein